MTLAKERRFYQALLQKDPDYEGIFYVGVNTTGVFCRPTCPARKPKFDNCEFFNTPQAALLAGYRPCKRCQPLSVPNGASKVVKRLVEAVEANPEKRWTGKDFRELAVHESTARRQFKQRFGMTFVAYARARRMGLAMKQIRHGETVIQAQVDAGYDSGSGFRDAFTRIMGTPPSDLQAHPKLLQAAWLDTPLGPMVAIGDEEALYLLEFVDRRGLEREVERLRRRLKAAIVPGKPKAVASVEVELKSYFAGNLQDFHTPLALVGSPFQRAVWNSLQHIPYGETRSYAELAVSLEKPTAYRAVASANGANQLAVVVPCHRVVRSNGELGGYGGGLPRKQWLLDHERKAKRVTDGEKATAQKANNPFQFGTDVR